MKRTYEPPAVRLVRTDDGSHVEPPLEQSWSDLEKLRWHAAIVESKTGIELAVENAKYWIGLVPQRGYFSLRFRYGTCNGSSGAHTYGGLWDYLNGIEFGAEAVTALRRAAVEQ